MKTTKPFGTISYNTPAFLEAKLTALTDRQVLAFWAFVYHYKEEDERKDHIHLICFPNGQYQTDQLRDYLQEPDLTDLTAPPLGIMPCQSSKWGDWFLYASHDTAYLASKGQTRKYHYELGDFFSPNPDYLLELVHTIDRSPYQKSQEFVKAIKNGTSFADMLSSGQVPVPQFLQWKAVYDFIHNGNTHRADRQTHTPIPDYPALQEAVSAQTQCEIAWLDEIPDEVSPFDIDPK